MMRWKPLWCACAVIGLLLPVGVRADQLPKSGTYSGRYSFSEHANVVPVEKDYLFTDAVNQGTFFNTQGGGFLHLATGACTSQGVIQNGQFAFSGYCAMTDKDNDKALLKWSCNNGSATKRSDRCEGTFDWIGGTGKYVGLRGHSVFDGAVTAQGPLGSIGDANWKGEWQLP
jgi:hypothetical protein